MKLENYEVYEKDKKDFELKIVPEIAEGKPLTIFCSFTYITPNYAVLFTLQELKRFADTGNYKVFLILWDMNVLSNAYFKRLRSLRKVDNQETFIEEKVKELHTLMQSVGFKSEQFHIYKASDLWKRMVSYKEENLFQQFYSMLAEMKTRDFAVSRDKISHLVQTPMDIFFSNYFDKLFPEDSDKPVDIVFFGQNKEQLYIAARELMLENGLIQHKNPLFVLSKNFPYLLYNEYVPEWNMSVREIKGIVTNCKLTKEEVFVLFHYLDRGETLEAKIEGKSENLDYESFYKKFKNIALSDLLVLLSENLYTFLQYYKETYNEQSGNIEEPVINISKKSEVRGIGGVLKSSIALEILLRADGTKNTTEIAKELHKSVATISMYTNKLKKMNLLRVHTNGALKRSIKAVKINLELGM